MLNDPFLLYAGNVKPHKNLDRLIEAFGLLRERGFDRVKLLIIGDQITKYAALRRAVHRCKLHRTSGSSGSCRIGCSPCSTAWPTRSSSRRSTRASGCRRSRPWRAARR